MTSTASSPPDLERSKCDGVRMTLEQFEQLPEEKPYLEYFGGRVVQKAVGKRRHGKVQARVLARLLTFADRVGGDAWPEAQVYFEFPGGHGYRVPDVAYWAPGKPQGDDRRSLPPTLAVEVRSIDQSLAPIVQKCRMMRAAGVDVCWLIDPETRQVFVFEGARDGELATTAALTSPYLPGFELPLDELWSAID
jgi:Uma2 family endonuclease